MTAIGGHFQMHGFQIHLHLHYLLSLRLRTMHRYLTGVAKPAVKRKHGGQTLTHLCQGPTVRVALTTVTLTVTVVSPMLSDTD